MSRSANDGSEERKQDFERRNGVRRQEIGLQQSHGTVLLSYTCYRCLVAMVLQFTKSAKSRFDYVTILKNAKLEATGQLHSRF